MQTDAKYRQQVVNGARLTAETATALASSALSKRTEKDSKADMIPGSKSEDRGDRGGRGRFKALDDALDQFDSIAEKQARILKGTADGIIEDISKSKDRVKHFLDRIKDLADIEDKPEDQGPGNDPKKGKQKQKKEE